MELLSLKEGLVLHASASNIEWRAYGNVDFGASHDLDHGIAEWRELKEVLCEYGVLGSRHFARPYLARFLGFRTRPEFIQSWSTSRLSPRTQRRNSRSGRQLINCEK